MKSAALTDVGRCRVHNEDGFGSFPELGLYLVVDGCGGGSSAPVAALAIRTARAAYADSEPGAPALVAALQTASVAIFERAREPSWRGMGATAVGLALTPGQAHLAHAGDCRAYRFREGALEQLTQDHSLLNQLLKTRSLSPQEVADFPHRNVVLLALGTTPEVTPDACTEATRAGDVFVLCSDGLHGLLDDRAIATILGREPDLQRAVTQLVAEANERGGHDNITALVVRV